MFIKDNKRKEKKELTGNDDERNVSTGITGLEIRREKQIWKKNKLQKKK